MRWFVVILAALVLVGGVALAWLGTNIAYTAVDPDAYRDSSRLAYLLFGGLFLGLGGALTVAAVALILMAFEYTVSHSIALVTLVVGIFPYPVLFGGPSIVLNLVLLGVTGLLIYVRRWEVTPAHDRGEMRPLE